MGQLKFSISVYEDLLQISKKLIWSHPLIGIFLSTLRKQIVEKGDKEYESIKTAAVGKSSDTLNYTLYINAEFWQTLGETNKIDILRHELEHIMFFHPSMSKSFNDKKLFNIAADLEINQHLNNLPDCNMTLEQYNAYMEENKEAIKSGVIPYPFRPCRLEDFGFDTKEEIAKGTRYYYDKLMTKANNNKDQSPQAKNLRDMLGNMGEGGTPYPCSHDTWKEFEDINDTESELIDENVKSTLTRIVKENIDQKDKYIGSLPGSIRDLIEELLKDRPPVFNWKAYLRKFLAKSIENFVISTRSKPNKRMEEEMPTIKIKNKFCLLVGVDTSGSMSDDDIKECFTEIHHIYKTGNTVKVAECDAALKKDEDVYIYKGKYPTSRKGLSGGGGTNMDPILKYANDEANNVSCVVHITDGYIPIPKVQCKLPVLIIIVPNGADPKELIKQGLQYKVIKMSEKYS